MKQKFVALFMIAIMALTAFGTIVVSTPQKVEARPDGQLQGLKTFERLSNALSQMLKDLVAKLKGLGRLEGPPHEDAMGWWDVPLHLLYTSVMNVLSTPTPTPVP
jgi:hypothetical protein